MRLKGLEKTAIKRIKSKVGQSFADAQGYDEPQLINKMLDALDPVIEEYISAYEYTKGPDSMVAYWDALDRVTAALGKLADEYVQRGL